MKYTFLIIFTLCCLSCGNKSKVADSSQGVLNKNSNPKISFKKELEIYDFEGLKTILNKADDKVYVVNFWATWCAPCVKELPYFEKINKEFGNKNVEVVLVSLDFPHLYETKLKPYIVKKNLKSRVIALDDPDMNKWIPQVSENWSGSIPATLIFRNDKNQFYEQSFTYTELENEVLKFLN